MEVYIGVDWAQHTAICTFGDEHSTYKTKLTPHPRELDKLLSQVRSVWPLVQQVRVALEAGSPLWTRLFSSRQEVILHLIDPKAAKRYAESLSPGGAKDDKRDSNCLFLMAMSPPHRKQPYPAENGPLSALEKLSGVHEHWVKARTAEVQRLRQQLVNTMPALSVVFGDLTQKSVLAFLRAYPTPEKVCSLTQNQLSEFAKGKKFRQKRILSLWQAIEQTFNLLCPEESEVQELLVVQLVARIEQLQESIKQVEKKIETYFDQTEGSEVMCSFKGIGPGLGSILLAEVFAQEEHTNRDSASIRVGAAPITMQSGVQEKKGQTRQKKLVNMRKTVPSRLRRLSYLLGLQAITHHDWSKAQYDAMRARGKGAACAFRAVSRSLLRLLHALLRDGTLYDRDLYVRGLQQKGVQWAMKLPTTIPEKTKS